jgi:hypothetical protein
MTDRLFLKSFTSKTLKNETPPTRAPHLHQIRATSGVGGFTTMVVVFVMFCAFCVVTDS